MIFPLVSNDDKTERLELEGGQDHRQSLRGYWMDGERDLASVVNIEQRLLQPLSGKKWWMEIVRAGRVSHFPD